MGVVGGTRGGFGLDGGLRRLRRLTHPTRPVLNPPVLPMVIPAQVCPCPLKTLLTISRRSALHTAE